mgnify:CR=1 FL=1
MNDWHPLGENQLVMSVTAVAGWTLPWRDGDSSSGNTNTHTIHTLNIKPARTRCIPCISSFHLMLYPTYFSNFVYKKNNSLVSVLDFFLTGKGNKKGGNLPGSRKSIINAKSSSNIHLQPRNSRSNR